MSTVAVIDYGMGNLHSVSRALTHAGWGATVTITSDPERVLQAERAVLPGVGALRDCMVELQRLGLIEVIREVAASRPFLAVCLGMQALLEESEENGGTPGLGIIPGRVVRFPRNMRDSATGEPLKVPHMGWNRVQPQQAHPLWSGIADETRFYFVHSYYVEPVESAHVAALTSYGVNFASAIARANVFAVQFHPEKSQQAGLTLLSNFMQWNGQP